MIDSNNPDPSVIALPSGGYLAVATSNYATDKYTEPAFPIYFSDNLVDWELQVVTHSGSPREEEHPVGIWEGHPLLYTDVTQ